MRLFVFLLLAVFLRDPYAVGAQRGSAVPEKIDLKEALRRSSSVYLIDSLNCESPRAVAEKHRHVSAARSEVKHRRLNFSAHQQDLLRLAALHEAIDAREPVH